MISINRMINHLQKDLRIHGYKIIERNEEKVEFQHKNRGFNALHLDIYFMPDGIEDSTHLTVYPFTINPQTLGKWENVGFWSLWTMKDVKKFTAAIAFLSEIGAGRKVNI